MANALDTEAERIRNLTADLRASEREVVKLRGEATLLRALDVANYAIIADLRNDLHRMTLKWDAAVRREERLDEAVRNYLASCGIGPNTSHLDRDLVALADAVSRQV